MSNLYHQWNLSAREAVLLQKKLAGKVIRENRFEEVKRAAGIDASLKGNWYRLLLLCSIFPV